MKTLYDMLGALADDDADSLRAAFRKAVKETHPDLNSGDPEAPSRFRQVIRAHAILSDPEQRAAYDWLLAAADSEPVAPSRRTMIYHTIHRLASGVIAMSVLAVVVVGGYTLFGHISKASIIPAELIAVVARAPAEPAAVTSEPPSDVTPRDNPPDRVETVEISAETTARIAAPPVVNTASAEATGGIGPAAGAVAIDAVSYRERGTIAYRSGDLQRAIAEFDHAIKLNPSFADAYIDRGIALYRAGEFDRAFADMAQAKRIQHARRTRHQASASPGRKMN